jgi:hypothetical protein|tara:strand:- start:7 stop:156 length:150 start_codon:yes stop_codon:yes gene_type:complete
MITTQITQLYALNEIGPEDEEEGVVGMNEACVSLKAQAHLEVHDLYEEL